MLFRSLLALLSDDPLRDGHALVQRQWRAGRAEGFDTFWRDSLRAGTIAGTASAPLEVRGARLPPRLALQAAAATTMLTALFVPDAAAHDGSFANNP